MCTPSLRLPEYTHILLIKVDFHLVDYYATIKINANSMGTNF